MKYKYLLECDGYVQIFDTKSELLVEAQNQAEDEYVDINDIKASKIEIIEKIEFELNIKEVKNEVKQVTVKKKVKKKNAN